MHFRKENRQTTKRIIRILFQSLLLIAFVQFASAQGNNLIYISGKVADKDHKPLSGVSVEVKGSVSGTITSDSGTFTIRTKFKFPITLLFTSVGFQPQEYVVQSIDSKLYIALETQTALGKEVVVTASRVSESRLK